MVDIENATRWTVCQCGGCPEVIPVAPCWCWEHLEFCGDLDCSHGAHFCDDDAHYCDGHA